MLNKLEVITKTYRHLKKYLLPKRGTIFYIKLKKFHKTCGQLFEIKYGDESYRKKTRKSMECQTDGVGF